MLTNKNLSSGKHEELVSDDEELNVRLTNVAVASRINSSISANLIKWSALLIESEIY